MAVTTAYFDGSGSPSRKAVVVGGLVAGPEVWLEFTQRWESCLGAYKVSALHMKDFAHSKGEFASWNHDERKRRRFLNELLWIIEDLVEYTAANAVWMDDYNSVDLQYALSEHMRPYTVASLACKGHIDLWADNKMINEMRWVFEKGDEDQDDLRKRWDGAINPIFCKKRDRFPDLAKCRPIRPLEAADLFAYEAFEAHTKLLIGAHDRIDFARLRKPMQRMNGLPGANEWGLYKEADLRDVCEGWGIPKRCQPASM